MPSSGLQPFVIEGFRGLDLASDPEEVGGGGSIDLQNVDLDYRGRVRQRDGWTVRKTLAVGQTGSGPLYAFKDQLVFGAKNGGVHSIYVIDSTYATLANQALTFPLASVTSFGTATTDSVYATDGAAGVFKWNGAAFSTIAGIPTGFHLAVQKPDNRLVVVRVGTNYSKVAFSDAGDPETFGANNYVLLQPNDGERITGVATWRELLIVFKQSKYFVFYGNSSDASGNPVFNVRAVENGRGISREGLPGQAIAAPEGVYFIDREGIFLTTGGPAVKVSDALDPLFRGQTTPFFSTTFPGDPLGSLAYVNGRLYFFVTADQGTRAFVYDPQTKAWTFWVSTITNPVSGAGWSANTEGVQWRSSLFGITTGPPSKLVQLDPTASTDGGTAISSYYRSGFFDLDHPGMEKTIRQTELVGQGTVAFSWSRGMNTAMNAPSAANMTLGTAPATARALHRNADYGELLSYKVASVSGGAWQVNRIEPMIQSIRPAGAMSS